MKLSLALATYNEASNLPTCLESAKDIVDEIVIVDGNSTDATVEIAQKYGARVILAENLPNFHINKQRAIDAAHGEWILQLDADEQLSRELAAEIKKVINMSQQELQTYQDQLPNKNLFLRHQHLIEARDKVGDSQSKEYAAFYFPRLNFFLGKYLRYGGVYPDGAIRLIKKGKAYLPAKDVHEVMTVNGKIGWMQHDLLHYDSPTFERYLARNSRYINLIAQDLKEQKVEKNVVNFVDYMIVKPISWFFMTTLRHKGILDGWQGVVFSFFSALRFPRAYWRYLQY